ncbi:hypothetical protein RE628_10085 [Paenibacillus sp. D2_2]|nr:hypothetical protein [Paenibacillus sp. D2_2]WMT42629.1 hypothetical protein RE628_10085 [Paenibacillus sp. D2_2]
MAYYVRYRNHVSNNEKEIVFGIVLIVSSIVIGMLVGIRDSYLYGSLD